MIESVYGFPCVENPHDFTPDSESCTAEEAKRRGYKSNKEKGCYEV